MKKSFLIALILLTAGFSPLFADGYDCCYDDCCYSDSNWSLYADYLYWRVCRSDLSADNGRTDYVNPGYDSGWRIGGAYSCGDGDIGVRYTKFETSDSKDISGNHERYKIDWQVVDIELGYALKFCCDRFSLRPFVGTKLAWIDEKHHEGDSLSEQDLNGYGLYVGTELRYEFCMDMLCCNELQLAFVARGSYGILDSTSDTRNGSNDRDRECLFLSTVEVFAGLDIGYECNCFTPHLMIGYEANTLPGWRKSASDNDIANLGLGGLVLRFAVDF